MRMRRRLDGQNIEILDCVNGMIHPKSPLTNQSRRVPEIDSASIVSPHLSQRAIPHPY